MMNNFSKPTHVGNWLYYGAYLILHISYNVQISHSRFYHQHISTFLDITILNMILIWLLCYEIINPQHHFYWSTEKSSMQGHREETTTTTTTTKKWEKNSNSRNCAQRQTCRPVSHIAVMDRILHWPSPALTTPHHSLRNSYSIQVLTFTIDDPLPQSQTQPS